MLEVFEAEVKVSNPFAVVPVEDIVIALSLQ